MKQVVQIDPELKHLIPGYLSNRAEDIVLLGTALSNNDFKSIEAMAHKIKGSAGGYGFETLGTIAAKMEASAKLGEKAEIENAFKAMQQYLSEIEVSYE